MERWICPKCHEIYTHKTMFCTICGTSLQHEMTEEMERKTRRQREEEAQEQLRLAVEQKKTEIHGKIDLRLSIGKSIFLSKSVYLPVDSEIDGDFVSASFSTSSLFDLGLEGWKVVGVVPRTRGKGLINQSFGSTMGETWGGGIGGIVIGVYVLLQKEISSVEELPSDEELIGGFLIA